MITIDANFDTHWPSKDLTLKYIFRFTGYAVIGFALSLPIFLSMMAQGNAIDGPGEAIVGLAVIAVVGSPVFAGIGWIVWKLKTVWKSL